jgi:hypothetical protein
MRTGGTLKVRAGLMPAGAPFAPGIFDFQRHAYFQGLSGYGYVTQIEEYNPAVQNESENRLEHYREWIAARVYQVLPQPEAGIVTALLNGQRAGISKQTTNMLQASGLQHIISISGFACRFAGGCRVLFHTAVDGVQHAAGAFLPDQEDRGIYRLACDHRLYVYRRHRSADRAFRHHDGDYPVSP